nr:TIGR00156 family protein [Candidatus Pantoea persica]
MKKQAALLAILALTTAPVFAATQGGFVDTNAPATQAKQGGFKNDQSCVVTVKQAEEMKDDSWITLRGQLKKQIGDENYLFRDATGTMEGRDRPQALGRFDCDAERSR